MLRMSWSQWLRLVRVIERVYEHPSSTNCRPQSRSVEGSELFNVIELPSPPEDLGSSNARDESCQKRE